MLLLFIYRNKASQNQIYVQKEMDKQHHVLCRVHSNKVIQSILSPFLNGVYNNVYVLHGIVHLGLMRAVSVHCGI